MQRIRPIPSSGKPKRPPKRHLARHFSPRWYRSQRLSSPPDGGAVPIPAVPVPDHPAGSCGHAGCADAAVEAEGGRRVVLMGPCRWVRLVCWCAAGELPP